MKGRKLLTLFSFVTIVGCTVTVKEVKAGEMVVLKCPSNDDNHRFQYWQLGNDQVIGPGNEQDIHKYKYEAWSGQLYIKSVSTNESGFYKCISKRIMGPGISIQAIELVVKNDWKQEKDTNIYKVMLVVLVLLMLILMVPLILLIRQKQMRRFSGTPRSTEESEFKATIKKTQSTSKESISSESEMETIIIDTDLISSFKDYE